MVNSRVKAANGDVRDHGSDVEDRVEEHEEPVLLPSGASAEIGELPQRRHMPNAMVPPEASTQVLPKRSGRGGGDATRAVCSVCSHSLNNFHGPFGSDHGWSGSEVGQARSRNEEGAAFRAPVRQGSQDSLDKLNKTASRATGVLGTVAAGLAGGADVGALGQQIQKSAEYAPSLERTAKATGLNLTQTQSYGRRSWRLAKTKAGLNDIEIAGLMNAATVEDGLEPYRWEPGAITYTDSNGSGGGMEAWGADFADAYTADNTPRATLEIPLPL